MPRKERFLGDIRGEVGVCCHCGESKELIPFCEGCWGCHEIHVMEQTGIGVVLSGPLPGMWSLNGRSYQLDFLPNHGKKTTFEDFDENEVPF